MSNEILDYINSNLWGVWYLIGAALVFWMQAGFAMVEAGFTRAKNSGNIIMKNLMDFCIGTVMFIVIGYSLLLGSDVGGFFGTPGFDIFKNYSDFDFSGFVFNLVFCATTATIVSGAMAERTKFISYCVYSAVISAVIYPIEAHWTWGGGFLAQIGSIDFAGGNVVHISSGVSGLVLAILIGKRKGIEKRSVVPHNIPFVVLGVSLLWFGWFGFNAGSALAADGLALHAFTTTNTSAACAMLSWMIIDIIKGGKPTVVGACTGGVIGLVAITPGAGFVPIWASFIIGTLVSPICYFALSVLKPKFGYDDALDAFGCHGIGGIWGGIATGLFAQTSINPVAKWDGLVFGDYHLFVAQVLSILVTIAVAVVGTLICVGIVRLFTKLRVDENSENVGLDDSEHGERAYSAIWE